MAAAIMAVIGGLAGPAVRLCLVALALAACVVAATGGSTDRAGAEHRHSSSATGSEVSLSLVAVVFSIGVASGLALIALALAIHARGVAAFAIGVIGTGIVAGAVFLSVRRRVSDG
jgi:hypothetical protein